MTPQQVKKALQAAGFEVFRTAGDDVVLADRVRENLILDSGVRVRVGSPLQVRIILRAQKTDFPSEDEGVLFERVRKLAAPALADGFAEVATNVTPVTDPVDKARTLDTFYEIVFAKDVGGTGDVDAATDALRFAMALDKTVGH